MPGPQHLAVMGCVGTAVPAQQQELLVLAGSGLLVLLQQGACCLRGEVL